VTAINPSHYCSANGIEVIDVVDGFNLNANCAKAVEYVLRADSKGRPIEDLEKALAYLEREIARRLHEEETGSKYLPRGRGFRSVRALDAQVAQLRGQVGGLTLQIESILAATKERPARRKLTPKARGRKR